MTRQERRRSALQPDRTMRHWIVRGGVVSAAAVVGAVAFWNGGGSLERLFRRDTEKKEAVAPPRTALPASGLPPVAHAPTPDPLVAFPGIASPASPQLLVLTGTVVGRNAREGVAFIGSDESNPQTYVAGALLPNGARLVEIASNYVVLERNGTTARLYAQNVTSRAADNAAARALLTVGGKQPVKPATATSSEELTDFIRPNPQYEGPSLTGFQVYPGVKARVFGQLGLKAGDVITAMDGAPLNDPQQAIELFRQLVAGAAMVATVERNGKTERITLDGAVIAADRERAQNSQLTTPTDVLRTPMT